MAEEEAALSGDFTVRLERVVSKLESVAPTDSSDVFQRGISSTPP